MKISQTIRFLNKFKIDNGDVEIFFESKKYNREVKLLPCDFKYDEIRKRYIITNYDTPSGDIPNEIPA